MSETKIKQIGNEKYRFFPLHKINFYDDATLCVESLMAHKMFTNSPLRRLQRDTSEEGKRKAKEYEELRKSDITNSVIDILEKVLLLKGDEFPFEGKEKEGINMMMKKALIYEMIQCLEIKESTTSIEAQGDLIFSLLERMRDYKSGTSGS